LSIGYHLPVINAFSHEPDAAFRQGLSPNIEIVPNHRRFSWGGKDFPPTSGRGFAVQAQAYSVLKISVVQIFSWEKLEDINYQLLIS
jgi:hypothetical protein